MIKFSLKLLQTSRVKIELSKLSMNFSFDFLFSSRTSMYVFDEVSLRCFDAL